MNIKNGVLTQATQKLSPNFDKRLEGVEIDLVVLHNISLPPNNYNGTYIEDFFCNQLDCSKDPFFKEIEHTKVSAHLLIKRSGDIVQFVNFENQAWHAGVSNFKGRDKCNNFSIGIEMEGSDFEPFEEQQYLVLKEVLHSLYDTYPKISSSVIVGHSDIAPGRKTDPGPFFDWNKIKS